MDYFLKSDVLEYPDNIVFTLRQKYNLEKPERMEEALDLLEDWIRKHTFITKKNFERRYLESFLISSKGSIERTKQRIEKLGILRKLLPEYFSHSDVRHHLQGLEKFYAGWLPKMDSKHRRIYLMSSKGTLFTAENFKKIYKSTILLFEYGRMHDYCDGYVVVLDFSNVDVTEVLSGCNYMDLKNYMTICMDGFGARINALHIVVPPTTMTGVVDVFLRIFKSVSSAKIFSRFHIHKNFDAVFKEVSQDIFPIDYGGKENITLEELSDKWVKELSSKDVVDFAKDMNQARVSEAYDKQSNKIDVGNLELAGSFRKLCVD